MLCFSNFLLLALLVHTIVAIRYIPAISDPYNAPRSEFVYQQITLAPATYQYFAAYGADRPNSAGIELHNTEVTPTTLSSDSTEFIQNIPVMALKNVLSESQEFKDDAKGVASSLITIEVGQLSVFCSPASRLGATATGQTTDNQYRLFIFANQGNFSLQSRVLTLPSTSLGRGFAYPITIEEQGTPRYANHYLLGGYNATNDVWYSDMFRLRHEANISAGVQLEYTTFRPMILYTAYYFVEAVKVYYFFGKNQTHTLGDVWEFIPANRNFNLVTVTPDPVYGSPVPRYGHAMIKLTDRLVDNYRLYIHGGTNGTHYFNDLWMFNYTQPPGPGPNWVRLDNPNDVLHNRNRGRAFHRAGQMNVSTDSTIIYFFGGNYSDGTPADLIAVDINDNCKYTCSFLSLTMCLPFGQNTRRACVTVPSPMCVDSYEDCAKYLSCRNDQLRCGVVCMDAGYANPYAGCPTNTRITGCVAPTPTLCWNNLCAAGPKSCNRIPPCPAGHRRCPGGSCTPQTSSCAAAVPTCVTPNVLCPDGTCQQTCFPLAGCHSDNMTIQCGDGSCVNKIADCEKWYNCSNNAQISCFKGCAVSYDKCDFPYWVTPITPFTKSGSVSSTQAVAGFGSIDNSYGNATDVRHIFVQAVSASATPSSISYSVTSPDDIQGSVAAVGPHPTWISDQIVATNFRSVVAQVTTTGIKDFTGTAYFLLRNQFRDSDPTSINTNKLCVAYDAPWYFDPKYDTNPNSSLASLQYIADYRNWTENGGGTDGSTIPANNFGAPARRWKCLNAGDVKTLNQWPIWLPPNTEVAIQALPDQFLGIALIEDFTNNLVVMIATNVDTPPSVAPPPGVDLAPPNKNAHYAVLAIVSLVLLVLLIVVAVKAFTRPH